MDTIDNMYTSFVLSRVELACNKYVEYNHECHQCQTAGFT